jgi:hypothetical protein
VHSVCPHVPKDAIKQDLIKTKSAEQTINRIFDGAIVRNNNTYIIVPQIREFFPGSAEFLNHPLRLQISVAPLSCLPELVLCECISRLLIERSRFEPWPSQRLGGVIGSTLRCTRKINQSLRLLIFRLTLIRPAYDSIGDLFFLAMAVN